VAALAHAAQDFGVCEQIDLEHSRLPSLLQELLPLDRGGPDDDSQALERHRGHRTAGAEVLQHRANSESGASATPRKFS
jgi:hypothetical protein